MIVEVAAELVDDIFVGAKARALSVKGFDPLNIAQPKRPWAGKTLGELK